VERTDQRTEAPRRGHRWSVGWLLPRVLALVFLLDLVARAFPLELLCFRAWECVTRYPAPGSVFQAGMHFESRRTYGNLANIGNFKQYRQYRPQVFMTDQHGFRNSGTRPAAAGTVLVLGDSLVAGDGLSDDETLTAQLASRTGLSFYNAGGPYAYSQTVRYLKSKLGLDRGHVLIVHNEALGIELLLEARDRAPDWKSAALRRVFGDDADYYRGLAKGWWYVSPLRIAAERTYTAMCNGEVLPNPFARNVVLEHLRTGTTVLFYSREVQHFYGPDEVPQAAEYYMSLVGELHKEGFTTGIVLVPSKYSVYHRLLMSPDSGSEETERSLARLATALHQQGIAALDLTSPFRAEAEAALNAGQYLYHLDDTHWNGQGVILAARLIEREWFSQPRSTDAASLPVSR